jgi:tetratricopeptide (TPR) repeat protein
VTSASRRAAFVLGGLAAGVLSLEVLLRLGGLVRRLSEERPPATRLASRVVLCEGDSFTWGVGGTSYPSRLERLLNGDAAGPGYAVVNKGFAGNTSSVVLRDLPAHLAEYRPDVLVLLIGQNDQWNTLRTDIPAEGMPWAYRLDRQLLRSRLYTFGKLLGRERRRRSAPSPAEAPPAPAPVRPRPTTTVDPSPPLRRLLDDAQAAAVELRWDEAASLFRRAAELAPGDADLHLGQANARLAENRNAEALVHVREAERLEPDWATVHLMKGETLSRLGDFAGAERCYRRAVELEPGSEEVLYRVANIHFYRRDWDAALVFAERGLAAAVDRTRFHLLLGRIHSWRGERTPARKHFREALMASPESEEVVTEITQHARRNLDFEGLRPVYQGVPRVELNPQYERLVLLERLTRSDAGAADAALYQGTVRNVRDALRAARRAGASAILCSYPETSQPGMSEVARVEGAEYVDFTDLFARRFAKRAEWTAFDDAHCNDRGYAFMAETLAGKVRALAALR